MILGRAHLPHSMFNLCEETLSRVKEYLNLEILQINDMMRAHDTPAIHWVLDRRVITDRDTPHR